VSNTGPESIVPPAGSGGGGAGLRPAGADAGQRLEAVVFDVDFTLAKPGPDLGPKGYRRLGERFGLELDPARYEDARREAIATLKRHPELDHDEEVWVLFTERIIVGMGGTGDTYACALEMTRAWERAEHFELFDDALPVLDDLRGRGLKLALLSNTGRDLDEFVAHHGIQVDAILTSRAHGKTKPHETIFRALLEELRVQPGAAAMVGDDPTDDVDGARAVGMRAWLVDRDGRFPDHLDRLTDLRALPAALGLVRECGS
jgi:putative hydrolase of the HAD superfamily